jgi:hypothetical protein
VELSFLGANRLEEKIRLADVVGSMQLQLRTGKNQSEANLRLRITSFQPAGRSVRYARGKRERSLSNTHDAVKRLIRPNCFIGFRGTDEIGVDPSVETAKKRDSCGWLLRALQPWPSRTPWTMETPASRQGMIRRFSFLLSLWRSPFPSQLLPCWR